MKNLLKSLLPIALKALSNGGLFRGKAEWRPPLEDILTEWDVYVPLSGGTNILTNVFKSK